MKSYLVALVFAFLFHSSAFAIDLDFDLMQSSPGLDWYSIENDSVRVIYPSEMRRDSVYVANLVDYYSHFVGKTYGIDRPEKFNLILRPEVAQPNGYVTLAPRRSEWFSSSTFFPYAGGTDWFQTLSIHEYRHVNQFDHFDRGGTKVLHVLAGEPGWQLAAALAMPSWFMEGDAVWAETKFTDAGRGRSPRFLARLKALVLSDQLPTYDQFLSGTYRTSLPNQYVYGFALVSYATQKYGDDVWEKVTEKAARYPYPLRFYHAFYFVTGQKFEDFYDETMADLKKKWSKDELAGKAAVEFRDQSAPFKVGDALYYIRETMDTYSELVRERNGVVTMIRRFPFHRELMGFEIKGGKAVYTEYLPHTRYEQKGSSDLFVIDLASGDRTRLTHGERIYNPSLNTSATKILATEFTQDQQWKMIELNLSGKVLRTINFNEGKVAEARYLDDHTAVVLMNSSTGYKSIVTVDLSSGAIKQRLTPESRNLIFSLHVDQNKTIVFEGQYKGNNEIFSLKDGVLARCTSSKIGAFTPSSDGKLIHFSQMDGFGSTIASVPLDHCQTLPSSQLADSNYLGDSPSDSYNAFPPQKIPNQAQLYSKNSASYQETPYGDFDTQLVIPHTWGLSIGRGGGLGVQTDNYLRTLGLSAEIGTDAEEGSSFADFSFDIKKFYPLFRFQVENRNRSTWNYNNNDKLQWTEKAAGVAAIVPYVRKNGFWNTAAALTLQGLYLDTSEYKLNEVKTGLSDQQFYMSSTDVTLSWSKDFKARSILAPWLFSYGVRYDDASVIGSNKAASSYRTLQTAKIQTPGALQNDGFGFAFVEQRQNPTLGSYRFRPESTPLSYTFSRGYAYQTTPFYQKMSADYFVPLAYPDVNLGRWYYLKRIYLDVFFDSTRVDAKIPGLISTLSDRETLNSYGGELRFDSTILRLLPLTLGGRVVHRLQDYTTVGEFFLASSVAF